jgi:aspartyl-tRNA(Asn)/glutamyl-tRNA(Gln) amidotransferase subunit B
MKFKIGLEIHVYINIENRQKLFCTCAVDIDAEPNTTICPICTAQPGAKPMLPNSDAVNKVIKTALMLGCKVNKELIWQRKHYDWPDLPKGYQNTMSGSYAVPVGVGGSFLGVGITECHLEEDPARWDPESGCVDYNRSGYPLIEIVTEPDFVSVSQVKDWLRSLMTTLGYVDAVTREMGVKCDVNVSIGPEFRRVEVKNVNSFSSIIHAIEHEIVRQGEEGVKEQQTRQWNEEAGVTKFMRSKEHALDYMFIPDPDLPVVVINSEMLSKIKMELPEKPEDKLKKLLKAGVEKTTAGVISTDLPLSELFERLSEKVKASVVGNWIRKELLRLMNERDVGFLELGLVEKNVLELLQLLECGKITEQVGREILRKMVSKPFSPVEYVKNEKLGVIVGVGELETLCKEVVKKNPGPVEDYRNGKEEALNFLVGQVMRASKGKAKPQELKEIFRKLF